MNFNKIIGYLLLFIGIAIIFWSLYSSYNIFTAKAKVPEIFEVGDSQLSLTKKDETGDLQSQIKKIIEEQFKKMMPADFLPKLLNLVSWSIFMGILILGGGKIASLGIKLVISKEKQ